MKGCPKTARKFFRSCARPFSVCFILGWSCCKMLEKEQSSNNLLCDLNITNKYLHLPLTKLLLVNHIYSSVKNSFSIFMVKKHLYPKTRENLDFVTQHQQVLPKKRKQAAANLGYFGFWAAVSGCGPGRPNPDANGHVCSATSAPPCIVQFLLLQLQLALQ